MTSNQRDRWSSLGACTTLSPEEADKVFFDPSPGRPSRNPIYNKYCGNCLSHKECFEWAGVHKVEGVWGNTTKSQRDSPLLLAFWLRLTEQAKQDGWLESYPVWMGVPPLQPENLADVLGEVLVEAKKFLFAFEIAALVPLQIA
jgi:hypothetical protein